MLKNILNTLAFTVIINFVEASTTLDSSIVESQDGEILESSLSELSNSPSVLFSPKQPCIEVPDTNVQFFGVHTKNIKLLHSMSHGWVVNFNSKYFVIPRVFVHSSLRRWAYISSESLAHILDSTGDTGLDPCFTIRKKS